MLTLLQVEDFAIIERLSQEFGPRMTVFTGETGAGKSIIVEALGLALGDRADSTMVRSGSTRASVTAVFDIGAIPSVGEMLAARGLDTGDECVLRRQIDSDGRSRAYVNGTAVPLQVLRELGEHLVDIHGQHAHQSLLRRNIQCDILDGFAHHQALLQATAQAYQQWKSVRTTLDQLLAATAHNSAAETDLVRFQVHELEDARIEPNELPELSAEHARLSNSTRLAEGCDRIAACIADGEMSAAALLRSASKEIQQLSTIDPRLSVVSELLQTAQINLDEAGMELRHYQDRLDSDPTRLAEIESRIGLLHDLARKHRVPSESLADHLEQLRARLEALESVDQNIEVLTDQERDTRIAYADIALKLSQSRTDAAHDLARRIAATMHEIGMPGGQFQIEVRHAAASPPTEQGLDEVEFLVSANPGLPLRPLAKVASGGELSRIGLAIQVLSASEKGLPTLVFDEVDAGIGGGVAEIVGKLLHTLGEKKQVLCVTHLPQVASQGHSHIKVQKAHGKDTTRCAVQVLDFPARVDEIARMLGGIKITRNALEHAREMLEWNSP